MRVAVLLVSVGLVAFGTATAGPVAFVALAAPQVAQRLAGTSYPPSVAAGLTGAVMVLVSDLVARKLIPDTELPVGIVTGCARRPRPAVAARAREPRRFRRLKTCHRSTRRRTAVTATAPT